MNRSPIRSSLTRHAALMQDERAMSEAEKRELGRRLWQQHGAVVVLEGWAPRVFWDALTAIARRLYGERRT
jgi:hypothetical protein